MILILHKRKGGGVRIIDQDHIEINVTDTETSARFYKQILGFDEVFVFIHWAVLQIEKPSFSLINIDIIKTENPAGLYFKVSSIDEITNILLRLDAIGGNVIHEPFWINDKQFTIQFSDYSGNILTLSYFKL